jgi:very-short-patch-repair endonuclease/DNA polymerase III delta prime subunit
VEAELDTAAEGQGGGNGRLEAVRRATKTWTGQLVDLTGRNNLLYYRDLKVGTLPLDSSSRPLIYSALAGRPALLSKLFPEEEELEDALKRARSVRNKANAHFEERGIETLYLACGMATWSGQKSSAKPAAPVLLVPVRLAARGATQEEFELTVTGELEVNPTFLQMLRAEFDTTCDPSELLESAGIEGIIDTPEELAISSDWLRRKCSSVPGFDIEERFVIGNFSYARMPMVRDLENSLEAMAEHDIVAALAGDPDAQSALRMQGATAEIPSPDFIPPSDEFLVLDADASQNYAINAVLAGKNLIIKGPPGTGKSQTISNLISTLVARGKRVLFVAEKRAAIDAVLKRLDEVELGDLVLDLHGGVSSKRKVAEALSDAIGRNASLVKPDVDGLHRTLVQRREQLTEHSKALHEARAPWGLSFFQVHSQLLSLPESARNEVRFRGPTLEGLGGRELAHSSEVLRDYVGRGGLQLRHSGSYWAKATVVSEDEASKRQSEVEVLRRQLPEVLVNLCRAASEIGIREPETVQGWGERFSLWRRVEAIYETWDRAIFELPLDQVIEDAAALDESSMARFSATLTNSEYRSAKKMLREALRDGTRLTPHELREAAVTAKDLQQDWSDVADAKSAIPAPPAELDALQASYEEIWSRLQELGAHLNRGPIEGSADAVLGELDALLGDISTLAKLPELHRLRTELEALRLTELLASLEARPLDREEAANVLLFAWLTSLVEHLQLSDGRLGSFDGRQHHELVREFQEADIEHIETTPQRVRRLCAEQAVQAEDAAPESASIIRAEANKRRKHLATRQLFSAAPEVMMAVKPCWAMSPLVVSQLLPSDQPYFDVVVFDEASQIRPAEAMPAILRGKQLVVAGDERQLPPTSFFATTNPEASEDEAESAYLSVDASYESILEALAAFIDFRMLEWHYRSRDERLIAFSNVYMYDRGMTTFPGVVGPDCISHIHVPFVPGEVGSETSAAAEVNTVVDSILEHAEKQPDMSLGVITMGIKHADRIDEALRVALHEREDEFSDFFDEDRSEPFFIKNLERVQGDERDAIILSVGYGKNADGRLFYRFGPLNTEGGERRLNVAVTRAKERMALISAFTHLDMDPERSQARGVELLRAYLEYCATSGAQLGQQAAAIPELNPFEVDVRDSLTRVGIPLIPQYGSSGYRIDFAAKHPNQPGRMVLAIECDGATYHSSQSARDRDRLRQEHLERLGWTFHRVWSQDWFTDKQAEVERAKSAYEAAVADADGDGKGEGDGSGAGNQGDPPKPGYPPADGSNARGPQPHDLPDRGPCPVRLGRPGIDDYSANELGQLIRWIESDTLLRTKEQLFDETIQLLGFRRRGTRIVAAIELAIQAERN